MDLRVLHDELTVDPLARGYAGMTDTQAAVSLNTVNRTQPRTTIGGNDLLAATTVADLTALTAAQRDVYIGMMQMASIDITVTNIRNILGTLFGAGTTTRTNLIALGSSTLAVSRAGELGLGTVTPGDVMQARGGGYK